MRLPGKDATNPEVFPFGTPYRDIFDSLRSKDEDFFRRNNLLGLVARNATIKAAPQRFQEIEGPDLAGFDVVLCFDSRVFYLVVEGTNQLLLNACLSRQHSGNNVLYYEFDRVSLLNHVTHSRNNMSPDILSDGLGLRVSSTRVS